MSMFWTIWISVITLGLIIGCYFLLRWTLANKTGVPEGESMGHKVEQPTSSLVDNYVLHDHRLGLFIPGALSWPRCV